MDISVQIGSTRFPNPVTVASGTFGHSQEHYSGPEVRKLGAIIPKTVTLRAQQGNPPPRICETPSGMINAIGIENGGVDWFIAEKLPPLLKTKVPVIVSVLGYSDEEFCLLAEALSDRSGVAALELNLSCPNLKQKSLVSQDPRAVKRIVAKVKQVARFPVLAKLSPNVTDIAAIAVAAQDGGADGISLVNTFSAMAIDVNTRRSKIGNFSGGLSGPAIRPIALRMVYCAARAVHIPVLAMGGIMTAEDALEFLIAGASMVAVGTANFIDPLAPVHVLAGIKAYLRKHRMKTLSDLVGSIED